MRAIGRSEQALDVRASCAFYRNDDSGATHRWMQHDLSAYDRPADLHDGLRETFNISPAGSRIPPELLSEIVQDAGDWELASALRVRTQLKMSPPWMEQATLLDRAILTGDAGFVERVYDEGHTRFTQWGARILTR